MTQDQGEPVMTNPTRKLAFPASLLAAVVAVVACGGERPAETPSSTQAATSPTSRSPQLCPPGPPPPPRQGEPPCIPIVATAPSASASSLKEEEVPNVFPEPDKSAAGDPARLLADLAAMQPFSFAAIDLNRIAKFLNAYVLLTGDRPDVVAAAKDIRHALNAIARMSDYRTFPTNMLQWPAIGTYLKGERTGPLQLVGWMIDAVSAAGALYLDFYNNYGDRLGEKERQGVMSQATGTSPWSGNVSQLRQAHTQIMNNSPVGKPVTR